MHHGFGDPQPSRTRTGPCCGCAGLLRLVTDAFHGIGPALATVPAPGPRRPVCTPSRRQHCLLRCSWTPLLPALGERLQTLRPPRRRPDPGCGYAAWRAGTGFPRASSSSTPPACGSTQPLRYWLTTTNAAWPVTVSGYVCEPVAQRLRGLVPSADWRRRPATGPGHAHHHYLPRPAQSVDQRLDWQEAQ